MLSKLRPIFKRLSKENMIYQIAIYTYIHTNIITVYTLYISIIPLLAQDSRLVSFFTLDLANIFLVSS